MHALHGCAAFAVGLALGLLTPGPGAAALGVIAMVVVAGVLLFASAGGAFRQRMGLLLLLSLGVVRGAGAGGEPSLRAEVRGQPPDLRELTVVGASQPGARCRVVARAGDRAPVEIFIREAGPCRYWSGQRLLLAGSARPATPDLPGPTREHLIRVEAERVWSLEGPPRPYWRGVARLRSAAFGASRGRPELGLLAAAGLGLREALPPGERDALRRAGLGHLIAVSGLHVALVAALFHLLALRVATLLGRGPGHALAVASIPLVAYVLLTGAAAPAVRAVGLSGVLALGVVLGRPVHGPTALALVLAAMLAWWPEWLLDPGFQMSAAAMAALVTHPRDGGALSASWRVAWALAPLEWAHFGAVPIHGVLLNLVAIPVFATWVLPSAILGLALLPVLGTDALAPASWGARLLLDLAQLGAATPPTPASLLAGVALLATLAHLGLVGGGWLEVWAKARRWLPPAPAAAALLLLIAEAVGRPGGAARTQLEPHADAWIAHGSERAPSLLRIEGGHACVVSTRGGSRQWMRIIAALDVPPLVGVTGGDGRARRLREELRRAGHPAWLVSCPASRPSPDPIRTWLRTCRRLRFGDRGLVRVVDGEAPACFVGAEWRDLVVPREEP